MLLGVIALAVSIANGKYPPIIAVDGFVVGYKKGEAWRAADDMFGKHMPAQTYTGFGIGKLSRQLRSSIEPDGLGRAWLTKKDAALGEVWLSGAKPTVPRPVIILKNDDSICLKIVQSLLDKKLPGAKARITKAVRTDLDGDGSMEYVIEALSIDDYASFESKSGPTDYSTVLIGIAHGDSIVGRTLGFNEERHYLCGIADIDGDGRMEIIMSGWGYEWNNATVFKYRAGKIAPILYNEDGV